MKMIKLLAFFFMLHVITACKKKSSNTNPSWSKCDINDTTWSSGMGYSTVIGDSLFSFTFSAGRYIKEDDYFNTHSMITFYAIPLVSGRQSLYSVPFVKIREQALSGPPFVIFSTMIEAGEFYCTNYKIYTGDSLNNWLEIERQEDNYRKVWGSYSITMIKDTSMLDGTCTRNTYGDTVRIRNARFYAEVAQ